MQRQAGGRTLADETPQSPGEPPKIHRDVSYAGSRGCCLAGAREHPKVEPAQLLQRVKILVREVQPSLHPKEKLI